MLTPAFELRQDSTYLSIIIKARYAKVSETEIFVDGSNFKFHSKPYFLRLNLPGCLIEDGREKASYDVQTGTFTVKIPKETPGEEFVGLDLLTKLLAPAGETSAKEPGIEVIGNDQDLGQAIGETGEEEEKDFDWQVEQHPFCGDEEGTLSGNVTYGFANRRSGVFKRLRDEICGVVDIEEADSISLPERKRARMMAEKQKFDDSHYLADFYQDDAIQPLLQFKPSWVHNYKKMREKMVLAGESASSQDFTYNVDFTEDEKELMMKLPRKEFILSHVEEDGALLGVADILFAYSYNIRSNEGEQSVESAWTVCKLSSTLSCLDWFQTPREMAIACCRRALCYPLYRSWALCRKLLKDVRMILRLGCNQVLKCFFDIHRLLSNDEPRYILNDLYISDYCVWLQSISNERLAALEQQIGEVKLEKKDIDLDLDELEEAASVVNDEEMTRTEHQNDSNLTTQEQSHQDQQQVIHQVGYPDLIRRSTPDPDIVTAHIVRAGDAVAMEREDASEADSDDDNDPINEGHGIKDDLEDRSTSNRTPTISSESDMGEVSTINQCALANNTVTKKAIANAHQSVQRLPQGVLGLETMDMRTKEGAGNSSAESTAHERGDEVEVVETMQDMLNQLSLNPTLPSSSSSSSSDHKQLSDKDQFPAWAQSPPTKLVEIFGEK